MVYLETYPVSENQYINGSQLYAGRYLTTKLSYEELNFKYSTFLTYEARSPCLRMGDVMPSLFFSVVTYFADL